MHVLLLHVIEAEGFPHFLGLQNGHHEFSLEGCRHGVAHFSSPLPLEHLRSSKPFFSKGD